MLGFRVTSRLCLLGLATLGVVTGAGVWRWTVATAAADEQRPAVGAAGKAAGERQPYGPPKIAANANPQVASVALAVREKRHPERLTPEVAPAPFDHAKYAANPQAYIDVVEPGRVFQVLEPGVDTSSLQVQGARDFEVGPGGTVQFKIKAPPGAPVTFTSFDMGSFENGLSSTTVRANQQGLATASWTAVSGTTGAVHLLAGSPLASGPVELSVYVKD